MSRFGVFDMHSQMTAVSDLMNRLGSASDLISSSMDHYRLIADQIAQVPDLTESFADLHNYYIDLIPKIDIYHEISDQLAVTNQLVGLLQEQSVSDFSRLVPKLPQFRTDLPSFDAAASNLLSSGSLRLQHLSSFHAAYEQIPDLMRGFEALQRTDYSDGLLELARTSIASAEAVRSLVFDSPMQQVLESIGSELNDSMRGLANHAVIQNQEAWGQVLTQLADRLELYADFSIEDLDAEEDTVLHDDEAVTRGELKSALMGISEELRGYAGSTVEAAVGMILARIAQIDGTFLKKLVFNLLLPLLLGVVGSVVGNFITKTVEKPGQKPRKIVEKVIKAKVRNLGAPVFVTKDYRFICVEVLNVRAERRRKSRLIGKLYLGQLIEVLERKKSWTLVEWSDEENDLALEGWVFSRYLGRIDAGGCRK